MKTAIALAALLLAGSAALAENFPGPRVDGSFFTNGFSMSGPGGGDVTYRVLISRSERNTFVVCGAYQINAGGRAYRSANTFLGATDLRADGRTLVRGLDWMSEVPRRGQLDGAPSTCQVTDTPFSSSAQISSRIRQRSASH